MVGEHNVQQLRDDNIIATIGGVRELASVSNSSHEQLLDVLPYDSSVVACGPFVVLAALDRLYAENNVGDVENAIIQRCANKFVQMCLTGRWEYKAFGMRIDEEVSSMAVRRAGAWVVLRHLSRSDGDALAFLSGLTTR